MLTGEIERILHDRNLGRGLAGARKMWRLLRRQLADGSIDAELAEQLGPEHDAPWSG